MRSAPNATRTISSLYQVGYRLRRDRDSIRRRWSTGKALLGLAVYFKDECMISPRSKTVAGARCSQHPPRPRSWTLQHSAIFPTPLPLLPEIIVDRASSSKGDGPRGNSRFRSRKGRGAASPSLIGRGSIRGQAYGVRMPLERSSTLAQHSRK